jgi:hypothetical protein
LGDGQQEGIVADFTAVAATLYEREVFGNVMLSNRGFFLKKKCQCNDRTGESRIQSLYEVSVKPSGGLKEEISEKRITSCGSENKEYRFFSESSNAVNS